MLSSSNIKLFEHFDKTVVVVLRALGIVHKGRPQSGGKGSLSSADNLRTRGDLQMRTSALFGAKKL